MRESLRSQERGFRRDSTEIIPFADPLLAYVAFVPCLDGGPMREWAPGRTILTSRELEGTKGRYPRTGRFGNRSPGLDVAGRTMSHW
jgi:hypothetical protein